MNRGEIDRQAKLLRELRSIQAEVQSEISVIEASFNAAMLIGRTDTLTGHDCTVTYETTTVLRFDRNRFKQDHADLYQQYTVSTANRRLIIS